MSDSDEEQGNVEVSCSLQAFSDHLNSVISYQRYIRRYHHQLQVLQEQNHEMVEALSGLFDPIWSDSEGIIKRLKSLIKLFTKHVKRIKAKVLNPIDVYVAKLDHTNTEIMEQDLYRLEYDAMRDNLINIRSSSSMNVDMVSHQEETVQTYKSKCEELSAAIIPKLQNACDSAPRKVTKHLQKLFTEEIDYHRKVSSNLIKILGDMNNLHARKMPSFSKSNLSSTTFDVISTDETANKVEANEKQLQARARSEEVTRVYDEVIQFEESETPKNNIKLLRKSSPEVATSKNEYE